jgi:hypothetical protein
MTATKYNPPQPFLMRVLVWGPWSYRRPRTWAGIRLACAIVDLVVGSALLSAHSYLGNWSWLGLISLAGSAVLFWTAYRLVLVAQSH